MSQDHHDEIRFGRKLPSVAALDSHGKIPDELLPYHPEIKSLTSIQWLQLGLWAIGWLIFGAALYDFSRTALMSGVFDTLMSYAVLCLITYSISGD